MVVDESGPDGPWPTLLFIVKPRTSRSETVRPRLVMTEAERDEYVDELVELGIGAIVQERIDGPRWLVQSVRGPGVFEHVAFRVLDEWPRGAGPASYKRNVEAPPTLVAAARALLDHVDYNGPSGISFMEGNGRFYPHDANLRLGASSPASPHAGFDFPRRAVEAVLELDGTPFSGRWRPGRFMRLDLELEALGSAWASRRNGGAPGPILRRILSVGFSRQGMLDPSPFDPFWVGQMVALRRAQGRTHGPLNPSPALTRSNDVAQTVITRAGADGASPHQEASSMPDQDLHALLPQISCAAIVDAMAGRYGHVAHILDLKSPRRDAFLGQAVTIRYLPTRKDHPAPDRQQLRVALLPRHRGRRRGQGARDGRRRPPRPAFGGGASSRACATTASPACSPRGGCATSTRSATTSSRPSAAARPSARAAT